MYYSNGPTGAHRSCCSEHATSGCDDVEVKQCVCDIDASCCDANGAGWDKNCVNQVTYHHCGVCKQDMSLVMTKVGSVPDTASGKVIDQDKAPAADEKSKAAAKTAETAGKAATAAHSAAAAAKPATGAAAGAAAGAHGDCDKAHKKGGCANKKLAACVCKHDSWCCDIEWDSHCVKQAAKKDICSAAAPKDANVRAKAATAKVAAVEKGEKKKHQVDAGKDAASSAKAESAEAESAAAEAEPKEKVAAAAMPEPENAEDKVKAVAKAAEDAVSKSEPVTAPVKDADGKAKAVNASQASPKDMIEAASNEVPKSEGKKAAPAGKNGHHCFKPGNCTHKPTLECACQHDSTCCDDEWDWDTLCSNVANYLCHHEADQAVPKSAKKAAEKMKMAKKIAHEATHLDAPAQDAMVTLDMDFAFVQKDMKTFKTAFSSDVGASLDIPAAEVLVTDVLAGSIKVKFTVPTAEKFALLEKKGMKNLPALGTFAGKTVSATGITAAGGVDKAQPTGGEKAKPAAGGGDGVDKAAAAGEKAKPDALSEALTLQEKHTSTITCNKKDRLAAVDYTDLWCKCSRDGHETKEDGCNKLKNDETKSPACEWKNNFCAVIKAPSPTPSKVIIKHKNPNQIRLNEAVEECIVVMKTRLQACSDQTLKTQEEGVSASQTMRKETSDKRSAALQLLDLRKEALKGQQNDKKHAVTQRKSAFDAQLQALDDKVATAKANENRQIDQSKTLRLDTPKEDLNVAEARKSVDQAKLASEQAAKNLVALKAQNKCGAEALKEYCDGEKKAMFEEWLVTKSGTCGEWLEKKKAEFK